MQAEDYAKQLLRGGLVKSSFALTSLAAHALHYALPQTEMAI